MTHFDANRPTEPRELRQFGVVVGGVLLGIASILLWGERGPAAARVTAAMGIALLLLGLFLPATLARTHRVWMALAVQLNRITTPILMGAVYFIVFTPFGLLMRAAGRNPLRRGSGSQWITRPAGARASSLERQF